MELKVKTIFDEDAEVKVDRSADEPDKTVTTIWPKHMQEAEIEETEKEVRSQEVEHERYAKLHVTSVSEGGPAFHVGPVTAEELERHGVDVIREDSPAVISRESGDSAAVRDLVNSLRELRGHKRQQQMMLMKAQRHVEACTQLLTEVDRRIADYERSIQLLRENAE